MAWIIQSVGKDLTTDGQIDRLDKEKIKKVCLNLEGDHFDRGKVKLLLEQAKIPRSAKAKKSALTPVCVKIEAALKSGTFDFDLFRQVSGWLATSKSRGKEVEEIMKELFYDQVFERFTEHDNQELLPDFREKFLPWLKQVLAHQKPS
jgi:hypothetical protein